MQEGIPINQVSPAIQESKEKKIQRSEVEIVRSASVLYEQLCKQSNSPTVASLFGPNAPTLEQKHEQLLEYNTLNDAKVSPDGKYLAVLSSYSLSVFCTKTWNKIANGELSDTNCNQREFDVDRPPLFFFPDSKHIGLNSNLNWSKLSNQNNQACARHRNSGVEGLTGMESFTVFSILSESTVAELPYSEFKRLGKAFHKGELVQGKKQEKEIAESSKYFKFHRFFEVRGYTDAPQCVTRVQHRPMMLAFGTHMAIYLLHLGGWDYDSPLTGRGYWMCPQVYDKYRMSTFKSFDDLGLISTHRDQIRVLRFQPSFFKFLETALKQDLGTDIDEKTSSPLDREIEMTEELLDFPDPESLIFESSDIEAGSSHVLVKIGRNKLMSIDLCNPSKRSSFDFSKFTEDLGEPKLLLAGKFLSMANNQAKKLSLFVFKNGQYEHILKLDDIEFFSGPYFLPQTMELLVLCHGEPWTYSLELLPKLHLHDLLSSDSWETTKSLFLSSDHFHYYLHLPKHNLLFCRLSGTERLLVSSLSSTAPTPCFRPELSGFRTVGWALSADRQFLYLSTQEGLYAYSLPKHPDSGNIYHEIGVCSLVDQTLTDLSKTLIVGGKISVSGLTSQRAVVQLLTPRAKTSEELSGLASNYGQQDQVYSSQRAIVWLTADGKVDKVEKIAYDASKDEGLGIWLGEFWILGLQDLYQPMQEASFREDFVCKIYKADQTTLIAEHQATKGVKVWRKATLDNSVFLLWTHCSLLIAQNDGTTARKTLDFRPFDEDIMIDISADKKYIAAFCASSGELKVYNSADMKVVLQDKDLLGEKIFPDSRQWFWFDNDCKYLFFLQGGERQMLEVYCLQKFFKLASLEVPQEIRCTYFWLNSDESSVDLLGAQVANFHNTSEFRIVSMCRTSLPEFGRQTLVMLKIPFSIDKQCEWGGTRRCLLDIQELRHSAKNLQAAQDRLLNLWSSLPTQIHNRYSLLSCIAYSLESVRFLKRYEQEILEPPKFIIDSDFGRRTASSVSSLAGSVLQQRSVCGHPQPHTRSDVKFSGTKRFAILSSVIGCLALAQQQTSSPGQQVDTSHGEFSHSKKVD